MTGWQWSFYLIAIFAGALLPLIFLFVPETAFRRDSSFNIDLVGEDSLRRTSHVGPTHKLSTDGIRNGDCPTTSGPISFEKNRGNIEDHHSAAQRTEEIPRKVSFAQSLMPFNGRKTDESFFKLLFRPLPLFFHPAIFWACLIQGTLIGWTVMIGVVLAAIFLGPPVSTPWKAEKIILMIL